MQYSDETYADIYDTDPPASLLEGDLTNVFAIHSLSKRSGMTGYVGFVAGDPEIMQRLIFRANPLVPQTFCYKAATSHGEMMIMWRASRVFSKKKRYFSPSISRAGRFWARGFTILWLRVPTGQTGEEYAIDLLNLGIVVSLRSKFPSPCRIQLCAFGDGSGIEGCVEAIQIWSQHIQQPKQEKNDTTREYRCLLGERNARPRGGRRDTALEQAAFV